MRKYLLGALCACLSLALLAGCSSTTAAPGGSGSAGASGSASGIISTLPDPGDRAIPAQVTAAWSEDAVSDGWDTVPAETGDEIAEDGSAGYTRGETLYAAAEVGQGASLTAEITFMGVLPDRALCYRDADGTERCFTLTVSGEDGSLLMTDISGEIR